MTSSHKVETVLGFALVTVIVIALLGAFTAVILKLKAAVRAEKIALACEMVCDPQVSMMSAGKCFCKTNASTWQERN